MTNPRSPSRQFYYLNLEPVPAPTASKTLVVFFCKPCNRACLKVVEADGRLLVMTHHSTRLSHPKFKPRFDDLTDLAEFEAEHPKRVIGAAMTCRHCQTSYGECSWRELRSLGLEGKTASRPVQRILSR